MKKVLVVDDSSSVRKLVGFALQAAGCQVISAENGRKALAHLEKNAFDAIVLDINMPTMNGFEFLKKIQTEDAHVSLPVIILSTEGQEQDKDKAMELGATDYIIKPFKPSELLSRIETALKR